MSAPSDLLTRQFGTGGQATKATDGVLGFQKFVVGRENFRKY